MDPRSTVSLAPTRLLLPPQTIWFTMLILVLAAGAMFPQTAIAQVAAQTPPSVLDGTAKLVDRANPGQFLRLVLGLERPEPRQWTVTYRTTLGMRRHRLCRPLA
jgi:hypothetical protein